MRTGSRKKTPAKSRKRRILILKRIRFLLIVAALVYIGWNFNNWFFGTEGIKGQTLLSEATISNATPENEDTAVSSPVIPGPSEALLQMKEDILAYIEGQEGQYGIYYENLSTGETFGIDEEVVFDAASTAKVPLNMYLYEKIKEGTVNPDGVLTYLQEDYEGGTGSIRYGKVGKQFTVRELSRLSITLSDNIATNMLKRYLGNYNIKKYMRELGGSVVEDEENVSTPKDMAFYMKRVYDFSREERELGGELLDSLLNTEFNDRLPALLPEDVPVAHKIGTQVRVFNDVGIVFTEEPYILSIMTRQIDEDTAADVIANISKKVYDYEVMKLAD